MNTDSTRHHTYQAKLLRRENRLTIRGAEYCINEWGEQASPLLVYLHGWADTGSTFQFVVDAFAEKWFVVAPDWRGFGRSVVDCESYWFPDYLADLHAILKHYSPDRPVRLVGHSMGANVAALYAGIFPDRVAAFVNVEGLGLPDSKPDAAPERYKDWISSGESLPVFTKYRCFGALARRIHKTNPGMDLARAEFVAREWATLDSDGQVRLRADPRHKLPNAVLYRRAEAAACWQRITADVLLVLGTASPIKKHFDSVTDLPVPNEKIETVQNAGHMIHFEAAAVLAALIERVLSRSE